MQSPQIVKASQGERFSFYHNGKICQGMVLGQQIYRHLLTVSSRHSLEGIYPYCYWISRQGVDVAVVIWHQSPYQMWVNLRHDEEISDPKMSGMLQALKQA